MRLSSTSRGIFRAQPLIGKPPPLLARMLRPCDGQMALVGVLVRQFAQQTPSTSLRTAAS